MAGGEGRRCRPLTQTRSKVMLPVGNRPFMEHVIRALAANGVRDVVVVVGYQKERVMNHFEDGVRFGVDIEYVEQGEMLGTAHALSKARSVVDQDFLLLNGDNLLDPGAVKDLLSSEGKNVILATLKEHSGDYGVLTVDQGRVVRIVEKPGRPCAGILNTGAYRFTPEIFDELEKTPISDRGSYELTRTIGQMIEDGKDVRVKMTQGAWADAVFPWDLLVANSLALGLEDRVVSGELEEGARYRGRVEVGKGSVIRSGCYIIGPVSIGRNCDIGPNVTVLPSTSIGDSVRIGSNTEIRNSIVMGGTRVGSSCIISDSVIGASCSFGDQTVVEPGTSTVEVEDHCYRTEFGSIVADDVVVGSRVLMLPGSVVGTDSQIGSGTIVRGTIDRDTKVI